MTSPLTNTGKNRRMTVSEIETCMKTRCWFIITEDFKFEVKVKDYKFCYGNSRFLIVPVAGTGEMWKNITELEFES